MQKMRRRKVELKRIEDKASRQVTFSKRRSGLIKKAQELSVLCDAELALIIFSSTGRLYEFSSGSDSLSKILERYWTRPDTGKIARGNDHKAEIHHPDCTSSSQESNLLQIVQRFFEGQNVAQLNVTNLVHLEQILDAKLRQIKERKDQLMMESLSALSEKIDAVIAGEDNPEQMMELNNHQYFNC